MTLLPHDLDHLLDAIDDDADRFAREAAMERRSHHLAALDQPSWGGLRS